ncbi:hypothetical protein, partial [Bacillus halotolerans]
GSIFDNIGEVNFEEDSQEEEEFAMPLPSTEYLQQLSAQLATDNRLTIDTTTSLSQNSQANITTPFLNMHHTVKDTETDCCCVVL